jgi:hypothetical protein
MNARHWPRLHKTETTPPFVRTDYRQWVWENDQGDGDIIYPVTDSGPWDPNGGQIVEQVILLRTCA